MLQLCDHGFQGRAAVAGFLKHLHALPLDVVAELLAAQLLVCLLIGDVEGYALSLHTFEQAGDLLIEDGAGEHLDLGDPHPIFGKQPPDPTLLGLLAEDGVSDDAGHVGPQRSQ